MLVSTYVEKSALCCAHTVSAARARSAAIGSAAACTAPRNTSKAILPKAQDGQ